MAQDDVSNLDENYEKGSEALTEKMCVLKYIEKSLVKERMMLVFD